MPIHSQKCFLPTMFSTISTVTLPKIFHTIQYTQFTSNNSWCVPLVDSWVEPTLSHVILQLMIVSIVGAKHQVGVAPQN